MFAFRVDRRGLDLKALTEGFSERRQRATIATALTRTAKIAQGEIASEIRRVFDRPTQWALNATYLRIASADKLHAMVWLKDRHGAAQSQDTHYLYPQVFGVQRGRKAYETRLLRAGVLRSNEFTVPAKGMTLDGHGNLPVGVIRSMLSQLGAASGPGYSSSKTKSKRSQRTVAKAGVYFVPRPGGGLPRGIYHRRRMGAGWATRMVLKIVVGKPRYRSRLKMFEIGRRVHEQHFRREYDRAFAASLQRLRARG